jgi:hypothetical protein
MVMLRTRFLPFALFASMTLFAGRARADVVAPPADGVCPDGTEGQDSHGISPAFCTAIPCNADADCTGGGTCAEQSFCEASGWIVGVCPNGDECMSNTPCTKQGPRLPLKDPLHPRPAARLARRIERRPLNDMQQEVPHPRRRRRFLLRLVQQEHALRRHRGRRDPTEAGPPRPRAREHPRPLKVAP